MSNDTTKIHHYLHLNPETSEAAHSRIQWEEKQRFSEMGGDNRIVQPMPPDGWSFASKMERERDDARLALLSRDAREMLECGWCGEIMPAPPGFQPPMTHDKLKQTVRLHLLDCKKHPVREVERELEETRKEREEAIAALHDAISRPLGVVPVSADKFYDPKRITLPAR